MKKVRREGIMMRAMYSMEITGLSTKDKKRQSFELYCEKERVTREDTKK